jgi:DNA-binding MarR family transcriptional regulator
MSLTKIKTSQLKSHLGFWLRTVSNQVSHSFARKLEQSGVTVAEWVILRELYELDIPVAPSEVAKNTRLTRGAISKLMDRLLVKKLVHREEGQDDRRYQTVQLTRSGLTLVPKLAKLADQNDEEFFGGLTANEKTTLLKIMKKIVDDHQIEDLPIE